VREGLTLLFEAFGQGRPQMPKTGIVNKVCSLQLTSMIPLPQAFKRSITDLLTPFSPQEEIRIKTSALFLLVAGAFATATFSNANAGSVVVWDGAQNVGAFFGHPVEVAKQRAPADSQRHGRQNVKIIGSSDVTGYGAIVVARHPNGVGTLIGVSLGNPSKRKAVAMAVRLCKRDGGADAHVKYSFKG
jgi:hypothetical protein